MWPEVQVKSHKSSISIKTFFVLNDSTSKSQWKNILEILINIEIRSDFSFGEPEFKMHVENEHSELKSVRCYPLTSEFSGLLWILNEYQFFYSLFCYKLRHLSLTRGAKIFFWICAGIQIVVTKWINSWKQRIRYVFMLRYLCFRLAFNSEAIFSYTATLKPRWYKIFSRNDSVLEQLPKTSYVFSPIVSFMEENGEKNCRKSL